MSRSEPRFPEILLRRWSEIKGKDLAEGALDVKIAALGSDGRLARGTVAVRAGGVARLQI